jgi:hypothetical protein
MKRLVDKDPLTGTLVISQSPTISDLPEWVTEAFVHGRFFMTEEDGPQALWIALPFEFGDTGVAFRAAPTSLLLYDDDEGYIRVLAEVEFYLN